MSQPYTPATRTHLTRLTDLIADQLADDDWPDGDTRQAAERVVTAWLLLARPISDMIGRAAELNSRFGPDG